MCSGFVYSPASRVKIIFVNFDIRSIYFEVQRVFTTIIHRVGFDICIIIPIDILISIASNIIYCVVINMKSIRPSRRIIQTGPMGYSMGICTSIRSIVMYGTVGNSATPDGLKHISAAI